MNLLEEKVSELSAEALKAIGLTRDETWRIKSGAFKNETLADYIKREYGFFKAIVEKVGMA